MSSWFISPWEAVRLSLEAQRLIAVQFFPFGPRRGQTHQEETTRDIKVVVPGLGSSADVPIPTAIEGNCSRKDSDGPQRHGRYQEGDCNSEAKEQQA
jgi:hypothetical protein